MAKNKIFKRLSDGKIKCYGSPIDITDSNDSLFLKIYELSELELYDSADVETWPPNMKTYDVVNGQFVYTQYTQEELNWEKIVRDFNGDIIEQSLFDVLGMEGAVALKDWLSIFSRFLHFKNFAAIKQLGDGLVAQEVLTSGQFTQIKQLFLAQQVDLDNLL